MKVHGILLTKQAGLKVKVLLKKIGRHLNHIGKKHLNQNKMSKVFEFLKKIFTHNYCDTCRFTKDKVYLTEYYTESGLIQCMKCYNETFKTK